MSLIIYLNGLLVHTDVNTKIAQSKQVNDIGKLSNRQTNYSSVSIPVVARNKKVLEGLGCLGVVNDLPYQKITCDVIDAESGERLIYQGWAKINQTTNRYIIDVYDGNIDFFKAIENRMMSELDLSSLDHERNLSNVVTSFDGTTFDFKYILADFNGQSVYDTNKININYLIPSTKIEFLWNKIFEYIGYTYTGDIFLTPKFKNRYITLPKGQDVGDAITEIFNSTSFNEGLKLKTITFTYDSDELDVSVSTLADKTFFTVLKDGVINISGTASFQIFRKENTKGTLQRWDWTPTINGVPFDEITGNKTDKTFKSRVEANAGQVFSFEAVPNVITEGYTLQYLGDKSFTSLTFNRYDTFVIDFFNSFSNFAITDFVNWVLQMYGLTMFKDKYSTVCNFKTINEITTNEDIEDWSDKFSSVNSENYIVGNYTQKSWMRYKYNNKDESHNDYPLSIDNVNLKDSSTIIQSPFYSPENSKSNVLGFVSSVYKLWDKSIKDDGTIEYKPLNNRFYILDEIIKTFNSPITIGSELEDTTIESAPCELFDNLEFRSLIKDNYSEISYLLNNAKLYDVNVFLRQVEVANIDFSKPKFIKQLGGYFILNKINNFIKNKLTRVELIKINYKQKERRHYSSNHYNIEHYD